MASALVPGVAVVLGALVPGAAVVLGVLVPGAAVAVGSVVVAAPPLSHAVITSRAAASPAGLNLLIVYLRSRPAAQSGSTRGSTPPRTARRLTAPDPSP